MISAAKFSSPEPENHGILSRGSGGIYVSLTIIFLCDFLAVVAAGAVSATLIRAYDGIGLNETVQWQSVLIWIGLSVWFAVCGLYGGHKPLSVELAYIAWGVLGASFLMVANQHGANVIGLVASISSLFTLVMITLCRYLAKRVLYILGLWSVPTMVIGPAAQCEQICEVLSGDWYRGFGVKARVPLGAADGSFVADHLANSAKKGSIRQVIIASETDVVLVKSVSEMHGLACEIVMLRSELPMAFPILERVFGRDPLLLAATRSALAVRLTARSKRCLDIAISAILLLVLLPTFVLVAYFVRGDGGAVFYPSARLGAAGKPFYALKFRTMAPDAEARLTELLTQDPAACHEWTTTFKLQKDPRITSIGRLLRRSSLDELPQLLNVLRGEMSLVGPRPLLPAERETYGQAFELYCRCTPGITGPWQVSGRNNLDYERRIQLNSWYALHGTLVVDLGILLRTVSVVFRGEGAV